MNVTLPPALESFVREMVESERYLTQSEVVRDALLLLQDWERAREQREEELRREIQKGIDSGPAAPLDMAKIKATGRAMLERERHDALIDAATRQAS